MKQIGNLWNPDFILRKFGPNSSQKVIYQRLRVLKCEISIHFKLWMVNGLLVDQSQNNSLPFKKLNSFQDVEDTSFFDIYNLP